MAQFTYIEDIFVEFYNRILSSTLIDLEQNEDTASFSFFSLCADNKAVTAKQAKFMLVLLKKYQMYVCDTTFDYTEALINPVFKHPFRVIDTSRRMYIVKEDDGKILVYFKFPSMFKDIFNNSVKEFTHIPAPMIYFSTDVGARVVDFYDINIIRASEFALENNFVLDTSVLDAVVATETAWENSETLSFRQENVDGKVALFPANADTSAYFETVQTGNLVRDQFLAKVMGYPLVSASAPTSVINKVLASNSNLFWCDTNLKLFELYNTLQCKIAIVLESGVPTFDWLNQFVTDADQCSIPRDKIKVCFRETVSALNDTKSISAWIKENDVGGTVKDGDIFIFNQKPAKWIFADDISIQIAVCTSLYPSTNTLSRNLFNTHPCVVYLSAIKPTIKGNKKIVKL